MVAKASVNNIVDGTVLSRSTGATEYTSTGSTPVPVKEWLADQCRRADPAGLVCPGHPLT